MGYKLELSVLGQPLSGYAWCASYLEPMNLTVDYRSYGRDLCVRVRMTLRRTLVADGPLMVVSLLSCEMCGLVARHSAGEHVVKIYDS